MTAGRRIAVVLLNLGGPDGPEKDSTGKQTFISIRSF